MSQEENFTPTVPEDEDPDVQAELARFEGAPTIVVVEEVLSVGRVSDKMPPAWPRGRG